MKTIIFSILLLFSTGLAVNIPDSLLTGGQKAYIESQTTKATVSNWTGMGKEIGSAINETLKGVSQHTNKFAETKIGKLAVFIVLFKVLGTTIASILSIILFTLITICWISFIYFKLMRPHPTKTITTDKEGVTTEETGWEDNLTTKSRDREGWQIVISISLIVYVIIMVSSIYNIGG